ncbi:MAG TPA: hypothetical protein PL033_05915 [Candidatus Brocadiia bacterium]|nr:hypothetical protein [Candidatus Brocadiia bacterium]
MLEKVNWNPDLAELLKFGRRMPIVFLIAAFYLWKAGAVQEGLPHHPFAGHWWTAWEHTGHWRQMLAMVFASVAAFGFLTTHLTPKIGLIVYRIFTAQGWFIGMVLARTAMTVAYLFVFTPVAIFFRLIGRDAMKRKFTHNPEGTYWEPHGPPPDRERYKRMF